MSQVAQKQNAVTDTKAATMTVVKEEVATPQAAAQELAAAAPVVKESPFLSLEKRIEKVEELTILIDKWRKLNEARKNLNGFKLGTDGLSSTITIKDASGQQFTTSHNIVVETVLINVKQILNEKIAEVEADINFTS
jgi:hypothetical protein